MTHGSVSILRRVFALLLLMSLASLALAAPSAPVLTSLATTTTSNPETVTGTATAGIEVRLYVNGVLMELTTAQPDGSFSTKIPLYDGSNTVHATAWDGTQESIASNTLSSTYTNTLSRTQGGTISVDTVWTPAGGAYQLTSNLSIAAGVEFRLMPGVEVRADSAKAIDVNGLLIASGTAASTVALRSSSASPNKNSWIGLRINATGYVDFDYALIEHATNAMQFLGGEGVVKHTTLRTSDTGVRVQADSSPNFNTGFEISGNTYGVVVTGNNVEAQNPLPVFTGGTILNNTSTNYQTETFGNGSAVTLNATGNWWGSTDVATIASKIVDNSDQPTLPTVNFGSYLAAQGGAPAHAGGFLFGPVNSNRTVAAGDYQVLGHLRIAAGVTLTIEPGATIRAPYGSFVIEVNGTLVARGTAAAPIIFRSGAATTKNSWVGVRITPTGYIDFDYATVAHATYGLNFEGGEGVAKHTNLHTNGRGVWVQANSSPTFSDGFDIYINTYGVVVTGNGIEAQNPLPVFTGGSIRSNTVNYQTESFGNGAAVVLNATGNWWGSADVATIANKIVDNSDQTTLPTVNFGSYLAAQGGAPAHSGSFLFGPVNSNRTVTAGDYQVLGQLRIAAGVTLTVDPGATLRAPYGSYVIEVNGSLVARGTAAAPIVFRSGAASPTRNSWTGLRITNTGYVDVDYATVAHAAYAMNFEGGEGVVKHTTLHTSLRGVWVQANSSPSFSAGFDIYNNDDGVVATGNGSEAQNPRPVFTGGAIRDNTYSNYKTESFGNGAATTLEATGNWWGSVDVGIVRGRITDRLDGATLPKVEFLDYLEAAGGLPYVTAYDLVFVRRDVDAVAGSTTRTEFVLNTAADATFEIRSEDSGALVRTVVVPGLSRGPNSFEWNGRKDDGTFAPDALYRLVPRLASGARSWSLDPAVPVGEGDGTGTIPLRFNPHRNELWKMEYQHRSGFAGVVMMTATPPGGTPFMPVPLRLIAAGSVPNPTKEWYYWDGRNAQGQLVDGTWDLYFESPRKPRPHYLRVQGSQPLITGTKPAPAIEVKADPYLVVHSYEQLSRFVFRVSLDSVVTVKLLPPGIVDPTSPQAIVLLSNQTLAAKDAQGTPIDHPVEWRGHEPNDVNRMRTTPEGSYTFAIEARSVQTQGTALYRGVLQLFQ